MCVCVCVWVCVFGRGKGFIRLSGRNKQNCKLEVIAP